MKRLGWILVFLVAASPAWAVKKMTVQQLHDLLVSLQQARKTDAEVAVELKQVELSEELTSSEIGALLGYFPGPLATEQISILEARSDVLAPPPTDLPTAPAPDAAAQKALLDKTIDYAAKTYAQLPHLTASKVTMRYQDNMEAPVAGSGKDLSPTWADPNQGTVNKFIHYIDFTQTPIESRNGAEMASKVKDKTPWGANGKIALFGSGPALGAVVQEAQAAGKLTWLRWETVNGKQTAVYSFAVDKKKSHYAVDYCCFPDTDRVGGTNSVIANTTQIYSDWKDVKATVPYRGELFIDPQTGAIDRLVIKADFKPSDVIHLEETRIDYSPVTVGGNVLILPVRTIISTEVVPAGDDSSGKFTVRHTLFTAQYKNYQLADATAPK
jgi:hypothetical protein